VNPITLLIAWSDVIGFSYCLDETIEMMT